MTSLKLMEAASLVPMDTCQMRARLDASSKTNKEWDVLVRDKSGTTTKPDVLHAHHTPEPKEETLFASQTLVMITKSSPGQELAPVAVEERGKLMLTRAP